MSVLVLALNPCIDAEWRVDEVLWEEKNNVHSERRWAGGKGINVARWLKHLGGKPQLLLPLGGKTGAELAGHLRGEKNPAHIIRLRDPTRVNVIVTTNAGRQMRFNPLGPKLSRLEWGGVLKTVERNLQRLRRSACAETKTPHPSFGHPLPIRWGEGRGEGLLILSGSLPRGVPVTAYALLIRLAHRFGVKTLLDCDGPAFAAAIKAHPFLVKPNEHELAQWWRKPLRPEAELVRAARALSGQTRGWVLVSRGAKRSLLINCTEGFQFVATPPRVKPRNTVGAGDALLAAVALQVQLGTPPQHWLVSGIAVGSSATQCPAGEVTR
jgi:fructose-1-phosphate kinase PfkB-like protein